MASFKLELFTLYISSAESFIPKALMSSSKAEISDGISIPSSAEDLNNVKRVRSATIVIFKVALAKRGILGLVMFFMFEF
jgi:hypothetical protein